MGFWIFMFIMTLLVPLSLILVWYVCPKVQNVNSIIGYRTSRSMRNQSTWDYAQKNLCSEFFEDVFTYNYFSYCNHAFMHKHEI